MTKVVSARYGRVELHAFQSASPASAGDGGRDEAADRDSRERGNESQERDDRERDDLGSQVRPPPDALREHRSERAGSVVDPDRRCGEDRDEDEGEGLHDAERGRNAARQSEALVRACEPCRQCGRLLTALCRESRDDLGIEIGRLPRGIAREEVVARDGARRPSLLLLEGRGHGEFSAGRLKIPV